MEKGAGILLHISSLPSNYGIGTFGKSAYDFLNFLKEINFKYWQILPLNPTGYKDSPYQTFSSFAINPYFIDLDILKDQGLLINDDLINLELKNCLEVDYGYLYETRIDILYKAYKRGYQKLFNELELFLKENFYWLDDYATFMIIKQKYSTKNFLLWDEKIKNHQNETIRIIKNQEKDLYNFYVFLQYIAYEQFQKLKKYANSLNIFIIGDIPIYVSLDSCDLWANRKMFILDENNNPGLVAGVPPDYFSSTGQLWGNPLYNYDFMESNNYQWWVNRISYFEKFYDYLRIDHFRGFESFYAIDANSDTALNGKWIKGPNRKLFDQIAVHCDINKIVVEDLGIITPEVKKLKDLYNFPGLKIVEFAFDELDEKHPYLPKNFEKNCIGYLGSHDNEPLYAYLKNNKKALLNIEKYYHCKDDLAQKLIEDLFSSNANVVILQMQDLLKDDRRMNTPGKADGNWTYRINKNYRDLVDKLYFKNLVIKNKRN